MTIIQIGCCSAIDLETMCKETDEVGSLETNNMVSIQTTKTEVDLA